VPGANSDYAWVPWVAERGDIRLIFPEEFADLVELPRPPGGGILT
jgi:hypothetical protein